MIEPSGLIIGSFGPKVVQPQPTVDPKQDPQVKQQLNKKPRTRNGLKRS